MKKNATDNMLVKCPWCLGTGYKNADKVPPGDSTEEVPVEDRCDKCDGARWIPRSSLCLTAENKWLHEKLSTASHEYAQLYAENKRLRVACECALLTFKLRLTEGKGEDPETERCMNIVYLEEVLAAPGRDDKG